MYERLKKKKQTTEKSLQWRGRELNYVMAIRRNVQQPVNKNGLISIDTKYGGRVLRWPSGLGPWMPVGPMA